MFTLPNAISLSRAALAPTLFLYPSGNEYALYILLTLLFCEATDFLDGHIARKTGTVSDIGKFLDPLTDSLYRLSVFVAFASYGWMPHAVILIFLFRDVIVAYARIEMQKANAPVSARLSGKLKALAQAQYQIGAVLFFGWLHAYVPEVVLTLSLAVAAAVTVWSCLDYVGATLALKRRA